MRISARREDGNFIVAVEDYGVGFDTEILREREEEVKETEQIKKEHIGISNIREREHIRIFLPLWNMQREQV